MTTELVDRPLEDALRRALRLLGRSGLRGAFGGGLAVIIWGQPRVTQDLDLVLEVGRDAVADLLQAAREEGYTFEADAAACAEELLEGGFLRLVPPADAAPVSLDLLLADTPLQRQALDRARTFELAGLQVPVLSPEDLILLKLVAFRPKDTFDLETVIDAVRETLDVDYLRGWADRLELRSRLEAFLAREPDEGAG
jgi:predicted nucleotidyltransferase